MPARMAISQQMLALNMRHRDRSFEAPDGAHVRVSSYYLPLEEESLCPDLRESLETVLEISREVGSLAGSVWSALRLHCDHRTGVGYLRSKELGEIVGVTSQTARRTLKKLVKAGAVTYQVLRGGVPTGMEAGLIQYQVHRWPEWRRRSERPGTAIPGDRGVRSQQAESMGPMTAPDAASGVLQGSSGFEGMKNIVSPSAQEGGAEHSPVAPEEDVPSPPPDRPVMTTEAPSPETGALELTDTTRSLQRYLNGELTIKLTRAQVHSILSEPKSIVLSRGLGEDLDFAQVVKDSLTRSLEIHRAKHGRTRIFSIEYFRASVMEAVVKACDRAAERGRVSELEQRRREEEAERRREQELELEELRQLDAHVESLPDEERHQLRQEALALVAESRRQSGRFGMPLIVAQRAIAREWLARS